jgi:uncharacterized protein
MSEQQNVALIQKMLEAFGRGDVQTILDHSTTDCEFYCPGPAIIPYAGTKRGRAEIQAYFDALIGTQSSADLSIDEFVAQGDTVVAIGRYTAKVKATGKPIDTPVILTFHMQDGKIRRHVAMGDTAAVAASYARSASAAS